MNRSTSTLRRARLAPAVAVALLCTLQAPMLSHAAALTQLSSDPYTNPSSQHRTQVEPDTFAFGSTIVSAFQAGRFYNGGASNIGWATSTDRGQTWDHGFLPATTVYATPAGPYQRASDPSVAYDARHKVWLISYLGLFPAGSPPGQAVVDVLVSRSTDGGLTWGRPVAVNKTGHFNDKNWTVCDDWTSSPFYGHCYTEFDDVSNINLVQMSTSTDGGLTWGPAQTTPDRPCVIGGQPVVQPNGTVVVPIDDCYEATLLAFRSTDGGRSWSRTVKAAQLLYTFNPGGLRSPTLPTAEVDGLGNVYVVWSDCRFEPPNCSANDLVLSTSPDGLRWTLPKRIPIDPIGSVVDHLIPGLAVDRSTAGVLAHLVLTYYYFPNSNCAPSACRLEVGFISSTNGGASWSAAQTVAGPMLMPWLANTNQGRMVGDYISTSLVPRADVATPAFAVAYPPTGGSDCGIGVVCHEATYTTPADLLSVLGGANAAGAEPTYAPVQQPALVRHTAN